MLKFKIAHAGFTHVGMKRDHNEDAYVIDPEQGLYIVADGMGGHNSGEIASKMAIETVVNFFRATNADNEVTWPYKYDRSMDEAENRLTVSAKLANSRIWEMSQRNDLYRGMGTTLVLLHVCNDLTYLVNVGDSRAYLFRDGKLVQQTEDHSLLNDYLKSGRITPAEAETFPHKNVIIRALGIKKEVQVDIFRIPPRRSDVFLMCSDGLSDMVPTDVLEDILLTTPDIRTASKLLVREANQRGGNDNITVVLAQIV